MSKFEEDLSYATHKKHTVKYKIVFVGDQAVGKSSVINRFIKNEFDSTHNPTVGIDFVSKNMMVNEKAVRLQLWDTAGQERFKSLIPGYLRDSHAIFLIYDVSNRESLENLSGWMDFVKEHRGDDVLVFVVGNKIDLDEEERVVTQDQVKEKLKLAEGHYVEVSAKTGKNLEQLFRDACDELLKSNQFEVTTSHINPIPPQKKKPFLNQKEVPIKNEAPIKKEATETIKIKSEEVMRGSRLQRKDANGKIVKVKNCC